MHSDIKARNVLLSGNRDVAKISDVGVAKFLNEMATQTQSAYVAWTFAYAAPEILMNQKSGSQVPGRTDAQDPASSKTMIHIHRHKAEIISTQTYKAQKHHVVNLGMLSVAEPTADLA